MPKKSLAYLLGVGFGATDVIDRPVEVGTAWREVVADGDLAVPSLARLDRTPLATVRRSTVLGQQVARTSWRSVAASQGAASA